MIMIRNNDVKLVTFCHLILRLLWPGPARWPLLHLQRLHAGAWPRRHNRKRWSKKMEERRRALMRLPWLIQADEAGCCIAAYNLR